MAELKICAEATTTKAKALTWKFVEAVREEVARRKALNTERRASAKKYEVPDLVDTLAAPVDAIEKCAVLRKVGGHECIYLGADPSNTDHARFIQADGSLVTVNRQKLDSLTVVAAPEKPKKKNAD